jgi:hypothetical protein
MASREACGGTRSAAAQLAVDLQHELDLVLHERGLVRPAARARPADRRARRA